MWRKALALGLVLMALGVVVGGAVGEGKFSAYLSRKYQKKADYYWDKYEKALAEGNTAKAEYYRAKAERYQRTADKYFDVALAALPLALTAAGVNVVAGIGIAGIGA